MLAQVVMDLRLPVPQGRRERHRQKFALESAAQWLWGENDPVYHFSLERVCERLERDPEVMAEMVWRALPQGVRERVLGVLAIQEEQE
jgi:hypothetical protein